MTLQGTTLTSTPSSSTNVRVNAARVVKADLVASNGVIHAIDAVILPKNWQLTASRCLRSALAALSCNWKAARGAFFFSPPRWPVCLATSNFRRIAAQPCGSPCVPRSGGRARRPHEHPCSIFEVAAPRGCALRLRSFQGELDGRAGLCNVYRDAARGSAPALVRRCSGLLLPVLRCLQ